MKKTVAIFGTGIAGLSAAHELAEQGIYNIILYDTNLEIGGMARSRRTCTDKGMPTEVSWRGYGPFYHNIFNLMKRIPVIVKGIESNVYDTALSKPIKFALPRSTKSNGFIGAMNWHNRLSLTDYLLK